MGTIGPYQILLVLLVILLVFGARKLPEIGGGLGRAIRNFRHASSEPDEIDITAEKRTTQIPKTAVTNHKCGNIK